MCGDACMLVEKLRADVIGRGHTLGLGYWPLTHSPATHLLCDCGQVYPTSLGLISKMRRLKNLMMGLGYFISRPLLAS